MLRYCVQKGMWAGLLAGLLGLCQGGTTVWAVDHDSEFWAPVTLTLPVRKLVPQEEGESTKTWVDHLSIVAETQPRFAMEDAELRTVRNRVGFAYALRPRIEVSGGYFWAPDIPEKGETTFENRIWQQVAMSHQPRGWGQVDHRVRLEQRFFENNDGRIIHRARYRLAWKGPVIYERGDIQLLPVLSQELLLNLNETRLDNAGVDQSRTFAGVSVRLNEVFDVVGGYQLTWVNKKPGIDGFNHVILVQLRVSP